MKKVLMATLAGLLMANGASASCNSGSTCEGSMLIIWVSSLGTTGVSASPFLLTNAALKNDIIQVRDDAAVARETGSISTELASVIQKIRAEGSEQVKGATDQAIINGILVGELASGV